MFHILNLFPPKTRQIVQDLKKSIQMATIGHKKLFCWSFLMWTIRGIGRLLVPIIASVIITQIQGRLSQKTLNGILIFWIFFSCFWEQTIGFLDQLFWDWIEQLRHFCYNHLFTKSFREILSIPPVVLENKQSSKIISTIDSLNNQLSLVVLHSLRICTWLVSFLGAFIILLKAQPLFAFLTLFCWLGSWYTSLKIEQKYAKEGELEKMRLQNDAEKTDHLDNMTNINSLQIQEEILTDIYQKMENYSWYGLRWIVKEDLMRFWLILWNVIPGITAGIIAALQALDTGDVGRFVFLTGLVNVMITTGAPILGFSASVVKRLKAYRKIEDELSYDHTLDLKVGKQILPSGGLVELKHVFFTYPESKEPVLKDISLLIKTGEKVAIIGNSGAGKTTLINVIQHAYEVQGGEVLINRKNVQKVSIKSLKGQIGYINQRSVFWRHKTIRENLLMFNPKATEKELLNALKIANLYDEIFHKEKGIDSKVVSLSAGQKQRLAIARTLLRKTPIIIMDEPTANLDTISQKKVLEGLKGLSKYTKTTVIFASNVPAEIASANRILLLENGCIVEDGNPQELIRDTHSRFYHRLKRYRLLFEKES